MTGKVGGKGGSGLGRKTRWLFDNRIKHFAQFVEEITSEDFSPDPVRDKLMESFHKKKKDALKLMRTRLVVLFLLYISLTTTVISSALIGVSSMADDSLVRRILFPILSHIMTILGWFAVTLGSASVVLSLVLLFVSRAVALVEADMIMIAMQIVGRSPRHCLDEHKIYDEIDPLKLPRKLKPEQKHVKNGGNGRNAAGIREEKKNSKKSGKGMNIDGAH